MKDFFLFNDFIYPVERDRTILFADNFDLTGSNDKILRFTGCHRFVNQNLLLLLRPVILSRCY